MPRMSIIPAFRSHRLPTGGKTPPSPPLDILCPVDGCPWTFARQGCLKRHMPKHISPEEREKLMIHCAKPGCTHKTLQKSNMNTHYNAKHTGLKPHICDKYSYCAADPSCLYRHILSIHPTDLDAQSAESEEAHKKKGRSRKPRCASDVVLEHVLPTAPSPISDYCDASSTTWSTPSPTPSMHSLLAYPPSPSTSSAWTAPSLASSVESLPLSVSYLSSPSSDDFALYSPTASSDVLFHSWDPQFEVACAAMVAPTQVPGPATQYPAQHLQFFQPSDIPALLAELKQQVLSDALAFPQLSTAYEEFTLESFFAPKPFIPPFLNEWDTTVY
ncbi:hypothetical protein B0H17DRAFT_1144557 [Mycena rosella]|uniref:C2H2-type domain-containing protein n=1 Tax=Mycena rosella TaxID=1033263 RepID=A0AAD7CWI4_MYCRO|nr:hypothetical protein B0H17DRAFT_1144557 [Mycena rosella]